MCLWRMEIDDSPRTRITNSVADDSQLQPSHHIKHFLRIRLNATRQSKLVSRYYLRSDERTEAMSKTLKYEPWDIHEVEISTNASCQPHRLGGR